MTNIVDTSMETVTAEFDAAEREIGTEAQEQAEAALPDPLEAAQREAEIAMASGMIATSLQLVITGISGVSVDKNLTEQAAHSYAVLIIKYFPGGIFSLLDRYKEEIAAGTATFVLIQAVSSAKAKKREEEEAEKAKEKAQKDKAHSGNQPISAGLEEVETHGEA